MRLTIVRGSNPDHAFYSRDGDIMRQIDWRCQRAYDFGKNNTKGVNNEKVSRLPAGLDGLQFCCYG